ncbi:MAG: ATP-binding cassette domain-containing protein [Oscillospiraceae bacterium]
MLCLSFLESLPRGISILGLWLLLTTIRTAALCIWSDLLLWSTETLGKQGVILWKLNIESLTKHYGTNCALKEFTVCLHPGVYGLLGPNGAGKSTLMNLLTDTIKRESGNILYDGKEILALGRNYRALVGYMPQQQGYYEEFTVGRFLYYMAALKGLSRAKAREEIAQFLEVVGLSDCLHKKMGSLSGGMRRPVLLVQALLGSPKILLLDEPTAGLDPEERIRIRNYISAIATERIVLLATHVYLT